MYLPYKNEKDGNRIGYELVKTWRGYEIRKPNGKFFLYISKVYKGEYTWVSDHTYAKHFSLETANKHIKKLKEKEC